MGIPRSSESRRQRPSDQIAMPIQYPVLVAMTFSAGAGWLTLHHCRILLHQGVGVEDGGGWTALILVEFVACMVAVSVALNL